MMTMFKKSNAKIVIKKIKDSLENSQNIYNRKIILTKYPEIFDTSVIDSDSMVIHKDGSSIHLIKKDLIEIELKNIIFNELRNDNQIIESLKKSEYFKEFQEKGFKNIRKTQFKNIFKIE